MSGLTEAPRRSDLYPGGMAKVTWPARLEITGGGGRQFVMRKCILVVYVAVNDQLITEPLVIEGRKSTIVFNRWIGARESG